MAISKHTRAAAGRGTKTTKSAISRRKTQAEIDPTPAEVRAAHDKMIESGAFERPYNRLVNRDPAETVAACTRIVRWLGEVGRPDSEWENKVADADLHGLVADALQHVHLSIAGFWTPGGRVDAMRKRQERKS